ncbi:hypothetical protein EVAR_2364_1 [Eumeta japonica]|uniref:Uncharacterized protein n=1 Tax=Eumeta variegata TaxID=151549 RepID=A0A4C1SGU3_EUMVA|nr:hypothetical protein EVAR_2364_1 [Eumeta japonica]
MARIIIFDSTALSFPRPGRWAALAHEACVCPRSGVDNAMIYGFLRAVHFRYCSSARIGLHVKNYIVRRTSKLRGSTVQGRAVVAVAEGTAGVNAPAHDDITPCDSDRNLVTASPSWWSRVHRWAGSVHPFEYCNFIGNANASAATLLHVANAASRRNSGGCETKCLGGAASVYESALVTQKACRHL